MTWLLALAAIAPLTWVVAWWLIRPRIKYRLHEPREPRLHRRRRLAVVFAEHAMDLLDEGLKRDALAWAQRAHHLDSESPLVYVSLGEVQLARNRPLVAREWFHRAHRAVLTQVVRELDRLAAGETAYGVARCHAVLAADAREYRQLDRHEDECLRWLQKAIDYDVRYCESAEHEPAFSELRPAVGQVVAAVAMGGDLLAC